MIPLSVPNFIGNEKSYVDKAIEEQWVSTGGAYIEKFERDVAEYASAAGTAACQSGTAALHLALMECGVKQNDLVIVPTLTFVAAVNPVRYMNADPVFMDCDDSLCIDPVKLEEFCTLECELHEDKLIHRKTGRHISALIAVHVFGNLADMEAIMRIASEYHFKVIEDACEAIGSYFTEGKFSGRFAGTIGDMGTLSFNGNKIITTGGGGMVISYDKNKAEHAKFLSTQAKSDPVLYKHSEVGYNYRMTNLQAALGCAQMEQLENFIKIKNENWETYSRLLDGNKGLRLIPFREGTRSNKWFYSLFWKGKTEIPELVKKLYGLEIQTRPIWGLIHEQPMYSDSLTYKIEKAKHNEARILNLPCSTNITEAHIEYVASTINRLAGED